MDSENKPTSAKGFLLGAAIMIGFSISVILLTNFKPVPRQLVINLPEEIQAVDSTDTLNAVVLHDTLFVTFKPKQ